MLVIDASVAVGASYVPDGFADLPDPQLAAPPLMWSEARSILRLALWRGQVDDADSQAALERLETCPVKRRDPTQLGREAWRIAAEMGWARTYDAEYVALARLLDCRLATLDARLRRGTERLGFVVTPSEL